MRSDSVKTDFHLLKKIIPTRGRHPYSFNAFEMKEFQNLRQADPEKNHSSFPTFGTWKGEQIIVAARMKQKEVARLGNIRVISASNQEFSLVKVDSTDRKFDFFRRWK